MKTNLVFTVLFAISCNCILPFGFPNPQGASSSTFGKNRITFIPEPTRNRPQPNPPIAPLPTDNTNSSPVVFDNPSSVETSSSDRDDKLRSKLCPRTPTAEYRFDLEAQKCSKINVQSHCGKNMIFYSLEDSKVYGHCDCNYNTGVPLVYHEKTKRCYYVYQQGYCKEGEWLELNKNAEPTCSRNKCYDSGRMKFGQKALASRDMAPEYVPLRGNGKCVELNKPSVYCKKDEMVEFFYPQQFYPSCRKHAITFKHLSITGTLRCAPGTYLSITGQCQPPFDFDFD